MRDSDLDSMAPRITDFATRDDLPRFAEMLSDPEVGRWLWFTPAPREMFEQFFAPLVDAQSKLS